MTSDAGTYQITIKGDGLAVDRRIDEETARAVLNLLMGASPGNSAGVGGRQQERRIPAPGEERQPSIREFLNASGATRVIDKIAAIGLYLDEYEEQGQFDQRDIVDHFERASESVPANMARDLDSAVKASLIAKAAGDGKRYYVTNTGREAAAAQFSVEWRNKTRPKAKPRRKPNRAEKTAD